MRAELNAYVCVTHGVEHCCDNSACVVEIDGLSYCQVTGAQRTAIAKTTTLSMSTKPTATRARGSSDAIQQLLKTIQPPIADAEFIKFACRLYRACNTNYSTARAQKFAHDSHKRMPENVFLASLFQCIIQRECIICSGGKRMLWFPSLEASLPAIYTAIVETCTRNATHARTKIMYNIKNVIQSDQDGALRTMLPLASDMTKREEEEDEQGEECGPSSPV